MIGCAFFDDEQPTDGPTDGLPHWATITEVSDFLDIPRNAVRSAVRRAVFNQEAWVKKVTSEGGSTFYVMNTSHETHQSHQERWKQQKALQAACLRDDLVSPDAAVRHAALLRRENVLQRWPHFRQWLSSQGIQIFQNLLAEEGQKKWEWRWGELHGEGCESEEGAVIAVLQNRFDANAAERKEHENRAFFHALEPQYLQKSPRKSFLFGSKDPRSH